MPLTEYYIGAMSGTSLDGMDVVLIATDAPRIKLQATSLNQRHENFQVVASHHISYDEALKERLLQLCQSPLIDAQELMQADIAVAEVTAECVSAVLKKANIEASLVQAIGSHGQTIRHLPPCKSQRGASWQIGDPNTIATLSQIPTVADFRRSNIALGGQGAPIAPAFHRMAFASEKASRSLVNIGGMANVSLLRPEQPLLGFDTGPGNVLMDAWIQKHQGCHFDKDGLWAAQGQVDTELLQQLLAHSFFSAAPPKSTGREDFNLDWLNAMLAQCKADISPLDIQATLLELTARSISEAHDLYPNINEIYICGGGAFNKTLTCRIQTLMNNSTVQTTSALGIDPQHIECCAFAWFAQQTMHKIKTPLTEFAGGSREAVLGGIFYG